MVTQEQRKMLVKPFLEEKVRATIKGLNAEESPGPNRILVLFYRDFWDLVGPNKILSIP